MIFETLLCHYFYHQFYNYIIITTNIILLSNLDRLVIKLSLDCTLVKIAMIDLQNLLVYLKL